MRIWITKPWPPSQLILLKVGCLLFGVVLGVWFGVAVRPYMLWTFVTGAALAVGPTGNGARMLTITTLDTIDLSTGRSL